MLDVQTFPAPRTIDINNRGARVRAQTRIQNGATVYVRTVDRNGKLSAWEQYRLVEGLEMFQGYVSNPITHAGLEALSVRS